MDSTSIDQPPLKKPSIEQKTLDEDGDVDLISNLPDAILSLIISKLPTKYAVGTSILSSRWKHLFSSIPDPSLDFDDSLFLHPSEDENSDSDEPITSFFVDFVHRVMDIILKDVPTITTFRLKCQRDYDDYQIIDWVCAALTRGLVWAQFIFDLNDPSLLFHTLSGCTTLIYLELENSIIDAPPSFCLPTLKYLVIQRSLCSDQALFSGCAVLENLIMRYTSFGEIQTLNISIPSLKSLIMEYCYSLEVPHKLVLDTPELDLLFYQCNVAKEYTVKNLNTLLKAHIDFGNSKHLWEGDFSQYDQNVADLITGCSSVESLYISKSSLTFFYNAGRPLPMFRNLKHLQLGGFDIDGWELLPEILDSAPNLEFLDITEDFYDEKGCYERFLSNLPVDVPVCLSSHLKKIEIWAFKGEEDEFKLVEYLLKNAKGLNKIKISCDVSLEKYFSTTEKLFSLKIISISKTCEIWISRNE